MHCATDETVCGLDEAGRGALAGPLVLAAVVLPVDFSFSRIAPSLVVRDSKLLSTRQRMRVYDVIQQHSLATTLETISARDINTNGINWAEVEGFRRLICRIDASKFIVDGRWRLSGLGRKSSYVTCMEHADECIPAVLSAGIVAKVRRDELMFDLHARYPVYGWDKNTGHGTAGHIDAIRRHGSCRLHRCQFVATALRHANAL